MDTVDRFILSMCSSLH